MSSKKLAYMRCSVNVDYINEQKDNTNITELPPIPGLGGPILEDK